MAENHDGQDRTLDPTPRKLEQARQKGDVPVSREGSAAGLMIATLTGMLLVGGTTVRRIGDIILPMIEQPESFIGTTPEGWRQAGITVAQNLLLALLPFTGFLIAGALLPHVLQNSIVISGTRIVPKLSNLSPARGLKRIMGGRALFEFAKALIKIITVGIACGVVGYGFYDNSVRLVAVDMAALPELIGQMLIALLLTVTLIAVTVAGIDVPAQRWLWLRRQRMSFQELKEELRSTEGDPHVKARLRALRRQRARRRMMQDVPKASVVITNPTHYAVALRYQRGEDAVPVVVAKGQDLVALRIRDVARAHNVPVVQDPPLARALHAAVEIGEPIPQLHFEAVAKIVGMIWARRGQGTRPGSQ
ncbi:Flagellar biosynthesis protein FlhB (plasmid) [Rhodovastum atsumiense]|uniref:EscU/YscU/HrcU family type III secretion system export apparatus switch protein n=1 Tax=Rhodovastum atsumiense TaxID=504468 RepID=UPI0020254680|nr:flagellar type III secretion system protein FlhB [Rhodovastum atsumiense]CAH2605434.1 Flagellar biosynthesis protein FlhB [Rhodovastum atsumiense]